MDPKILLDKVCSQERAIMRLGRRLGRKSYWLNAVEDKLGMSVRDFLKLDEPVEARGTPKEEARLRGLAANQADVMDRLRTERDEAQKTLEAGLINVQKVLKERDDALAGKAAAERQEQVLLERLAILDKSYGELVDEKEDAVEGRKQAHDRAQALHVVIDQAVHALGKVHYERTYQENCVWIDQAVHILTSEDNVVTKDQARDLLDQHPHEGRRRVVGQHHPGHRGPAGQRGELGGRGARAHPEPDGPREPHRAGGQGVAQGRRRGRQRVREGDKPGPVVARQRLRG